MAATQKPQHILGTTAMLCSQGGLGKGGVPSLGPPPHTQTTTRDQQQPTLMKTEKKWPNSSGIYITETERMKEPVQTVRGFLTFGTIAFYLGFLQDGS